MNTKPYENASDEPPPRFSLAAANNLCPDRDFESTADNLVTIYDADEHRECWSLERVPIERVNPFALTDDPDDANMENGVERIRQGLRDGADLPPVYLMHEPGNAHPYYLLEGMRRYNALYREQAQYTTAWVAHLKCC